MNKFGRMNRKKNNNNNNNNTCTHTVHVSNIVTPVANAKTIFKKKELIRKNTHTHSHSHTHIYTVNNTVASLSKIHNGVKPTDMLVNSKRLY